MGVEVTMVTSDGHSKIPMQEKHVNQEHNFEGKYGPDIVSDFICDFVETKKTSRSWYIIR